MKKKLVSLLLVAVMALSVCACGAEKKQESSAPAASKSEAPAASSSAAASSEAVAEEYVPTYPIVDEPITVKGVVVSRSTEKRSDRLVWNKVSEVTGINIEWEVIDSESLATYMAGNDWPDFFQNGFSTSMVNDYGVTGGRFVNFNDYLDIMPNLVQTMEDYPISRGAITEVNGEIYRLPYVEVAATSTGNNRPYLRTDVLEAAGLKMPTTIDEFYNCLKVLKDKNGVASFIPSLTTYWGPILFAAFGTETELEFDAGADNKVYTNYTSEQMKLYLSFMNKLYEEGLIHKEFLTLDGTVKLEEAKSGKVAFIGGSEGNSLQAADFADGEFHLDCNVPLTSEYDSTQTLNGYVGINTNAAIVINAESEYVEELCKMMDIMFATEEVVEGSGLHGVSFCYGMEGEQWSYNPDGKTYEFHTPEEYGGANATYQYAEVIWANSGRCDGLAGLTTSTIGNSYYRQQGFVNNVIPYQEADLFPLGWMKFTEDEQYVLDNKKADISSYVTEMQGKFVTGVADIDTDWDKYCQTLEQMGINDLIEVYQASYDRWVASMAE
jgi:putative aldouronate transport system substrate-binding protein